VVVELELVVAKMADMACAAVAKLLGVAGGLVAEGLMAEEQKIRVNYNKKRSIYLLRSNSLKM
jgi:hypothetical protein